MYQSIKRVVKPETFGGLNRIPAPCHRQALEPAPSVQALLATVADEDIVRDSLLDIETIESVTCFAITNNPFGRHQHPRIEMAKYTTN